MSEILSCVKAGDTPSTPLLQAHVGDAVAIHVLGAFSEQVQLFTVDGHEWPHEPYMVGADQVSTMEFGGLRSSTPILPVEPDDRTRSSATTCGRTSDRRLPTQDNGASSRSCRLTISGFSR